MAKTTRGFSLIELLAVIAIIGILSAIILPVVQRVRTTGQNTTCQSNLRQIYTAMNLYATDNGRYPASAQESPTYITWYMYLLGEPNGSNYLGSAEVLGCPAGSYGKYDNKWPLSYGMTSLPVWISGGRTDAIPAFFTNLLHRRSQWPLLMDTDYQRIFSLDNPTEGAPTRQRFTARHDDKANILMADGHVGQAAYGDTQWSQQNLNREGLYDR